MNTDTPEAKAFREQFKSDIMKDPQAAYDMFLANAEDATNSPDPVIANKGWERIRELVVLSAIIAGAQNPATIDTKDFLRSDDTDAIVSKVKDAVQPEIDALAKSKDDDFAALSKRISSLEMPLDPNPVNPNAGAANAAGA